MYCETILYNLRSNKSIGYTMPADLGIVARDVFGLNATVYMHGMALPWLLQKLYPEARANCNTAQIRVVTGKRHLSPEEREIRAVVVGPGAGLHWILCRPDRIYMDPATGKNYDSFKSMGQLKFLKYVSTGVSVIVAKPVLRNSLRNSITLP
jgi:hypothetical protein